MRTLFFRGVDRGVGRVCFFQIQMSCDHLHITILLYVTISKTNYMFVKLHNNQE